MPPQCRMLKVVRFTSAANPASVMRPHQLTSKVVVVSLTKPANPASESWAHSFMFRFVRCTSVDKPASVIPLQPDMPRVVRFVNSAKCAFVTWLQRIAIKVSR
jgi:hypothetical protein